MNTSLIDMPSRVQRWRQVRRLLVVRVDNLGNVLMTTPALAAAAASVPGIEITLLGNANAAALAPHLSMVQHVITARGPGVRQEGSDRIDDDYGLIARIAAGRFDAAIVFSACTQSALPAATICRLAGVPLRLAQARENSYEVLTDWVPETDLQMAHVRHEVDRQLDLVAHVGWHVEDPQLRFALHAQDQAGLQTLLAREAAFRKPQLAPWVVVHVGASAPARRWPPERFGAVAEALIRHCDARVIFTGSTAETPWVEAAQAALRTPSLSLTGRLSLGELGALVDRADLVVTNNSGPAHLAAALGTPVVDVYALTSPQQTPWQVPSRVLSHDVPCRYCLQSRCPQGHQQCLQGVNVDQVVEAALELLSPSLARQASRAHAPSPIPQPQEAYP